IRDDLVTGVQTCALPISPVRCREVEASLRGQPAGEEAFASAAAAIQPMLDPTDDVHATAAYRRSVAGVLTRRALTQTWQQLRSRSEERRVGKERGSRSGA